jgi:hypothetical protein
MLIALTSGEFVYYSRQAVLRCSQQFQIARVDSSAQRVVMMFAKLWPHQQFFGWHEAAALFPPVVLRCPIRVFPVRFQPEEARDVTSLQLFVYVEAQLARCQFDVIH